MSEEIKEILDEFKHLVEISDYKNHYHLNEYFEVEYIAKLLDYITNLQDENISKYQTLKDLQEENEHLRTQVNAYENPDDLTLFYMWLDEKAKDKMKALQEENERLKELKGDSND